MAKFNITIGNKTYQVEIDDISASPTTVAVDGQKYSVAWEREATVAAAAPEPRTAATQPAPKLTPKPARPAAVAPSGKGELVKVTAPMPGKILQINVSPGDRVKVGQQVCSLEAMKMESGIQSTAAGIVVSVSVTAGQTVQYGDTLVTIEKQGE